MRPKILNAKIAKDAKRGAFTLIECLTVVVLLAVAMGTLAVGVAPSVEAAQIRDARSAVLDVDARARVLAQQGRVIVLSVKGGEVTARDEADPRQTPLLQRALPDGVAVTTLAATTKEPVAAVRIGADGRSDDYMLRIASGSRSGETVVAGLTGYAFAARHSESGGAP